MNFSLGKMLGPKIVTCRELFLTHFGAKYNRLKEHRIKENYGGFAPKNKKKTIYLISITRKFEAKISREIRYAATHAVPNPCQVEAQIGAETETILLVDAAVWESQHDFGCSWDPHASRMLHPR